MVITAGGIAGAMVVFLIGVVMLVFSISRQDRTQHARPMDGFDRDARDRRGR